MRKFFNVASCRSKLRRSKLTKLPWLIDNSGTSICCIYVYYCAEIAIASHRMNSEIKVQISFYFAEISTVQRNIKLNLKRLGEIVTLCPQWLLSLPQLVYLSKLPRVGCSLLDSEHHTNLMLITQHIAIDFTRAFTHLRVCIRRYLSSIRSSTPIRKLVFRSRLFGHREGEGGESTISEGRQYRTDCALQLKNTLLTLSQSHAHTPALHRTLHNG